MASLLGSVERDDDLVALAWADLVVTARTSVGLVGLVRLHVPDVDRRVVVVVGVGPVVLGHRLCPATRKDTFVTTTDAVASSAMSSRRRTIGQNVLEPTRVR